MTPTEDGIGNEVALRRARVEHELARLRASLGRETAGRWQGRPWSLLLLAAAVGVAVGGTVFRRRRGTTGPVA